jgi:hypothetical protein
VVKYIYKGWYQMQDLSVFEKLETYSKVSNEHDSGYKYLLSVKRVFIDLIRSFVPREWVKEIDDEKTVKLDKSYVLDDFSKKESDIVYSSYIKGRQCLFYVLLELQSTVDFQMPLGLLIYMTALWRDYAEQIESNRQKRKSFKLPVIIPIVLYNGKSKWTATCNFRDYLSMPEAFDMQLLDFEYIVLNVQSYDDRQLLDMKSLMSAVFLIDKQMTDDDVIENLKKVADMIKVLDPNQQKMFFTWVEGIISKRAVRGSEEEIGEIIRSGGGNEDMVSNLGRVLDRSLRQSKIQGKREGLSQGKQEGLLQGKVESILELLGEISEVPEDLIVIINEQKDLESLKRWHIIAAKSKTIEEFRSKIKT